MAMSAVTIKLSKPVAAHGEDVSELTFRDPVPEDIMQIGTPTLLIPSSDGETVGIEIRAKLVGQYISRLGSIPMSSVKALSISDFMQCQGAVMGFFGNGGGEA
jgi:hypothetical protein